MDLVSDIILLSAALGAGLYCHILSRRLTKLNSLEKGLGGAVAAMSVQVDDLQTTLKIAQKTAQFSVNTLQEVNKKAEDSAHRLEILLASMHDLPDRCIVPASGLSAYCGQDIERAV